MEQERVPITDRLAIARDRVGRLLFPNWESVDTAVATHPQDELERSIADTQEIDVEAVRAGVEDDESHIIRGEE